MKFFLVDFAWIFFRSDSVVDALVLGSSHAFEDVNTGTLWGEYGMASYILAGSSRQLVVHVLLFKRSFKNAEAAADYPRGIHDEI